MLAHKSATATLAVKQLHLFVHDKSSKPGSTADAECCADACRDKAPGSWMLVRLAIIQPNQQSRLAGVAPCRGHCAHPQANDDHKGIGNVTLGGLSKKLHISGELLPQNIVM